MVQIRTDVLAADPSSPASPPSPTSLSALDHVASFTASLRQGCDWAVDIQADVRGPPDAFLRYAEACRCEMSPYIADKLYRVSDATPLNLPDKAARVISGGKCVRFRSPEVSDFLEDLFVAVRDAPCKGLNGHSTEVVLQPWDLSHCHVVTTKPDADMAIVFHAKEFPREYRHTFASPVLPLGDPSMGGASDPRIGSHVSSEDANYHLRNYIYLLSTNRVYLLDPTCEAYPRYFVAQAGCEFHTFPEWRLGHLVGDVNSLEGHGILVAPRGAFTLTHRLSDAVHRLHALLEAGRHPPLHSLLLASHAAPEQQQEGLCRAVEAAASDVASLLQKANLRDLKEFLHRGSHALGTAEGVPQAPALTREEHLYYHEAMTARLPQGAGRSLVHIAAVEVERREGDAAAEVAREMQELLGDGVAEAHAMEALEATRCRNSRVSAFRARQLLETVHPQYRAEATSQLFGSVAYPMDLAVPACKDMFYAEGALEALALHAAEGVPLEAACTFVSTRRDAAIRAKIRKEQVARQQQRAADDAKM